MRKHTENTKEILGKHFEMIEGKLGPQPGWGATAPT